MHCDRASELISADLDQELDAQSRREIAEHLASCPACAALAQDFRHNRHAVAALGREPAPGHLMETVRRRLDAAGSPSLAVAVGRMPMRRWLSQAAALVLLCGLTAAAAAFVTWRLHDSASLEREVVAAHVRALLQDSPTQIASSESHTVKPWFAGRLEFAPPVRDLTGEGFPLAGARLDYIGEKRVAALVYRRRLHVVNVFLWPAAQAAESAPRALSYRGYNLLTWSRGGIAYWAISDLNADELRQLQTLL